MGGRDQETTGHLGGEALDRVQGVAEEDLTLSPGVQPTAFFPAPDPSTSFYSFCNCPTGGWAVAELLQVQKWAENGQNGSCLGLARAISWSKNGFFPLIWQIFLAFLHF